MKSFWIVTGLFLLTVACLVANADEKRQINSILASVNGEAVTLLDVLPVTMQRENQLRAVYSGKLLEQEIHALRKKTVDQLIDSKLLQREYAKQSFRIANRDIERELDRIAENMGCRSREEFWERLRRDGVTLEEVRGDLEKNMMVQTMIQRKVIIAGKITPADVYGYFLANKDKYAREEKIALAMLKVEASHPDAAKVIAEITGDLKKADVDFAALVKKYDPGAGDGNLGEIERSLLRPEFSTALKNISPGMIVGPLQIDGGTVWLKVVSYQPPVAADFKDVENQIKRDLEVKRRSELLEAYSRQLRENAVVEYYF